MTLAAMSSQTPQETGDRTSGSAIGDQPPRRDGGVNIIAGAMIAGTVALVVAALSRDVSSGESQSVAITVTEGATLNLEVNGSMITSTKPRT
jgi:hypothetical protein